MAKEQKDMYVKLLTVYAGPLGCANDGDIACVSAEHGKLLIDSLHAEAVDTKTLTRKTVIRHLNGKDVSSDNPKEVG